MQMSMSVAKCIFTKSLLTRTMQQLQRARYSVASNTTSYKQSGPNGSMSAKPIIRGVIFDMDGTLTVPVIDFALMRQRVGIEHGDILDAIQSRSPSEQERAYGIIAEVEWEALQRMQIMPGAVELCRMLDSYSIPRGLITRNNLRSLEYFHSNHFPLQPFLPSITRECAFPYKPSPAALTHICETWGVSPSECMMVGDSAKDDVVSGNRAGAISVLLDWEGQENGADKVHAELCGELKPQVVVHSLEELSTLLQKEYQLLPPPSS